jgi:Protein of unknown function (DUF616)
MSFIVYTAITGNYDLLQDPPEEVCDGVKFVAFMENPIASRRWEIRPLEKVHDDPRRCARFYKLLSHYVLPEAEFSLWIDGSIDLIMPFSVTNLTDYLLDADLTTFEHSSRCCIYQEACECLKRSLDDSRVIYEQVQRYTQQGYPANLGLVEAGVLLRRHSDQIKAFNEVWWKEIQNGSRRDQLSFNYVAHQLRLRYNFFPNNIRKNGMFRPRPHGIAEAVSGAPHA